MRKKIFTVEEESQQWEKLLGEHEIQRYWALEAGLWLTAGEIREQTPSKIQRGLASGMEDGQKQA